MARQFDCICDILTGLGYLERHVNAAGHIDMTLTEKGSLLRRIYSEHDLELCEALLAGTFDKLDANGLAAVLSSLVYRTEALPGRHLRAHRNRFVQAQGHL